MNLFELVRAIGYALIVVGIGWIHLPSGLIAGGALLVWLGLDYDDADEVDEVDE